MNSLDRLIEHLEKLGVLENPLVLDAFRNVDRADFILPEHSSSAYVDAPLPIGFSQTISQPYTVAVMLHLLEPQPGLSFLDIGSGSGWTTALLARIAGDRGRVLGLERRPELVQFGSRNLSRYPFSRARISRASIILGDPGQTYDRILVSASASRFPEELTEQLNPGGILVIPVGHSIWKLRNGDNGLEKEEYYGYSFVPLICD